MAAEFCKYWFKITMHDMDNFEINYQDDVVIKELTYIEMKDLTEVMSELARHVRNERQLWAEKHGKEIDE